MDITMREERANAVSHGIGVLLSIVAVKLLIDQAKLNGDAWQTVSFSIYGGTLILLYTCSTLLHSFPNKRLTDLFELMDHAAIYLLIAGSYTPYLLVTLRGTLGWTLFGIIWGLALIGIVLKFLYIKRFMLLSTICYIVMGWLIVFAFKPLYENLPYGGIAWLVIGGFLYTFGSIFYVWRKLPYHHTIWHIFVLAGSICHFFSIIGYVR